MDAPEVWWSRNLAESTGDPMQGLVFRAPSGDYFHQVRGWPYRLPSDAVQLVVVSEGQYVGDPERGVMGHGGELKDHG